MSTDNNQVIDYGQPEVKGVWRNPLVWIAVFVVFATVGLGYLGKYSDWSQQIRMRQIAKILENTPVPMTPTKERLAQISRILDDAPPPTLPSAARMTEIDNVLKNY